MAADSATLKRRRGIARGSLTRLKTRVGELEARDDLSRSLEEARRLLQRLDAIDSDFKSNHLALIDAIEDEGELDKEQGILDDHDDDVTDLTIRLNRIISTHPSVGESGEIRTARKRLSHLQNSAFLIRDAISEHTTAEAEATIDVCLFQLYEERLTDLRKDLEGLRRDLLSVDLDEGDELITSQVDLEKLIFGCSLKVRKLLQSQSEESSTASADSKGVKLPKLEVPKFDGNILNWITFWEQFNVSVHQRTTLSDAEKLVYLRHSLKDGSAKNVIEGLSRSGDCYLEAVECLKGRYNRPRLIHQAHVRVILEAPSLKTGGGKELRRLHDVILQHLRALKAMGYEPSSPFLTSIIELKLDQGTMFEWQKHSQASTAVPSHQELLDFLNLRAQASESSAPDKKVKGEVKSTAHSTVRSATSFATSTTEQDSSCVVCKTLKHPLYACPKFKSMPHDKKMSTVKVNELCMNCLKSGHFARSCKSLNRCKKCQGIHHTSMHIDTVSGSSEKPPDSSLVQSQSVDSVPSHATSGHQSNSLLMTCYVSASHPDDKSLPIQVRALLDPASSTSIVSERLARCLGLPRSPKSTKISGVAGLSQRSPTSITRLIVSGAQSSKRQFNVTAIVVPQVTCDLPTHPIKYDSSKWTHLSDISLADPDFDTPGRIDILLGVEVFVEALLHDRRIGPVGSPTAFETEFGWVLAGRTDSSLSSINYVTSHHVALLSGDDILRKFWELEEPPLSDASMTMEERLVMKHFAENHSRKPDGYLNGQTPDHWESPEAKQFADSCPLSVRCTVRSSSRSSVLSWTSTS